MVFNHKNSDTFTSPNRNYNPLSKAATRGVWSRSLACDWSGGEYDLDLWLVIGPFYFNLTPCDWLSAYCSSFQTNQAEKGDGGKLKGGGIRAWFYFGVRRIYTLIEYDMNIWINNENLYRILFFFIFVAKK